MVYGSYGMRGGGVGYSGGYGGGYATYAGAGAYGGGGVQMGGGDGCEDVFCEEDPAQRVHDERWAYVGRGQGEYSQVTSMQPVGAGNGDFTKEKVVVKTGMRCRLFCIFSLCLMVLLVIVLLIYYMSMRPNDLADDSCAGAYATVMAMGQGTLCCSQGYMQFCPKPAPQETVIKEHYITHVQDLPVAHVVPVPDPAPPAQVTTHKVYVHSHAYDCEKGYDDWKDAWSSRHQRYCCYLKDIACKPKLEVRTHYHTVTKVEPMTVPVRIPVPAPPPAVVTHVVNDPIRDPPQVIQVPKVGAPHVVNRYVHERHYNPVPVPTPPQYHSVPVPVKVTDPGRVIPVHVQMPPQTVVRHKTIYKTRHVKVKHVYDCVAGFDNWKYGWSSAKKTWCCDHQARGCPGTFAGAGLTKAHVTHITQHLGHVYYSHAHDGASAYDASDVGHTGGYVVHHVHHYYHSGDVTGDSADGATYGDASADGEGYEAGSSYGDGAVHHYHHYVSHDGGYSSGLVHGSYDSYSHSWDSRDLKDEKENDKENEKENEE